MTSIFFGKLNHNIRFQENLKKILIYSILFQKLSATYLARSDLCLLSGGQSMNWYETWNVTEVNIILLYKYRSTSISQNNRNNALSYIKLGM